MKSIINFTFNIVLCLFSITALAEKSFITANETTNGVVSIEIRNDSVLKSDLELDFLEKESSNNIITETDLFTKDGIIKNNKDLDEELKEAENILKNSRKTILNNSNPLKLNYYDEDGINKASIEYFAEKLISIDILSITHNKAEGLINIAGTNCSIQFKKNVKNIAQSYCTNCQATKEGPWVINGFSCPNDPGFIN